jgi:hypothetical protein
MYAKQYTQTYRRSIRHDNVHRPFRRVHGNDVTGDGTARHCQAGATDRRAQCGDLTGAGLPREKRRHGTARHDPTQKMLQTYARMLALRCVAWVYERARARAHMWEF